LCDVAWSREQNLGRILFMDDAPRPVHPRSQGAALPQVGQVSAEPAEPAEIVPAREADLLQTIREVSAAPTCGRCGYWRAEGGGTCDFLGMGSAATEKACTAFFSRKG
jgi:hypothetical protein